MNLPRSYANSAVLPDGKVFITGGASKPKEFFDGFAHFQPGVFLLPHSCIALCTVSTNCCHAYIDCKGFCRSCNMPFGIRCYVVVFLPVTCFCFDPGQVNELANTCATEIWDPETETFTLLDATHKVARTYHSVAVLLTDGRVFTGGGGLCGTCDVNHLDAEIFNPPYLFNADGTWATQPNITVSAKVVAHGGTLQVTANEPLMMVSMIRMSSATHSTNTDQRRIELCGPFTTPCGASPINVTVSADPGIATPGYWMFFGVNVAGTPSKAATVLVG
jgi:hypothetical protein